MNESKVDIYLYFISKHVNVPLCGFEIQNIIKFNFISNFIERLLINQLFKMFSTARFSKFYFNLIPHLYCTRNLINYLKKTQPPKVIQQLINK